MRQVVIFLLLILSLLVLFFVGKVIYGLKVLTSKGFLNVFASSYKLEALQIFLLISILLLLLISILLQLIHLFPQRKKKG
ncbi:MAG TPA: hypothetical protein ENG13_03730 [bacterium]|nr:hypothetical protein [bacterium]HEX68159.1 hypothetical protein [bacterium]